MATSLTWFSAFTLTALLVEGARRFAPYVGLVDSPTDRKNHQGDVPLVGGIAIFVGLLLSLGLTGGWQDHSAFLIGAAVLVLVGNWDDVRGISPLVRLAIQGGVVLFVAYTGDAVLLDLGAILPGGAEFSLGWMSIPFTLFAGIGLINAFNMADGVDGLCGSLTLIALIGLGIVSFNAGLQSELLLVLILTGSLVGFLVFNVRVPGRKQAKAFLGDAGSYLLGLSVLYLCLRLSQGAEAAMPPVAALWFCMLPLLDTVGMILRRLKRGRSPFSPDREHLHHVFLLAKFTVTETWVGLAVVATLGMVTGLAGTLYEVPELLLLAIFVLAAFLYNLMITRAWKVMRFLSRSINRRNTVKRDRRSGQQRRRNSSGSQVNGVAVERRSGIERRQINDDRRTSGDETTENVTKIKQKSASARPDTKAARVS